MIQIYGHPLASFVWKVLIALYERHVPFEFLMVDPEHPDNALAVQKYAPTGQFPVLVDADRVVIETAAIIEYLDLNHGSASPIVPSDRQAAIETRQMDGVFDDYVIAPLTRMVANQLRPPEKQDIHLDGEAQATLDKSYRWLDAWMADREWATNGSFTLADCAAASALFYAHWGYPIPETYRALRAYRARLLQRPSIARVIDEAQPWFEYFPLKDRGSRE